jgi:hypothetical protein
MSLHTLRMMNDAKFLQKFCCKTEVLCACILNRMIIISNAIIIYKTWFLDLQKQLLEIAPMSDSIRIQ